MKNKILILLVSLFSISLISQEISIGKRDKLHSKILQEDREFSVYFPPSYNTSLNEKYPVLYILDGDYNFQYIAGFLELQGGISEIIPENDFSGNFRKGEQRIPKELQIYDQRRRR